MRILTFGSDRALFDDASPVRKRVLEQARLVEEMAIVVFAPRRAHFRTEFPATNLTIIPTNSLHKFFYVFDALRIGWKLLKQKGKKDWLVSAQDPFESGFIAYLLTLVFRVPLHVQLHTDPFNGAWRSMNVLNVIRLMIALLVLRRADSVRVVSLRVKRGVMEAGIPESRITLIPIFVDIPRFMESTATFDLHDAYPGHRAIILSAGRLEKEKNFASLLRAFAKVLQFHEDALLVIVGSGSQHESLVELAEWLNIDHNVQFLSWSHDMISYYKTADVYVQASLYEGWGMAVIEAMASGLPVVMTDVGCAGEVVLHENTGLVVPVDDDAALADALLRIIGDEALAENLAENGRAMVGSLATKEHTLELYQLSWEQAAIEYAKKYQ